MAPSHHISITKRYQRVNITFMGISVCKMFDQYVIIYAWAVMSVLFDLPCVYMYAFVSQYIMAIVCSGTM